MDVGAGLYMYVVVVQKFTFAISSPDEFLSNVLSNAIFRTVVHQLTLRVAGPSAIYELLVIITARVC